MARPLRIPVDPRHQQEPAIVGSTSSTASVGQALAQDDQRVVARIRAGDIAAFDALFAAYYAPLCEFVAGYVKSDEVAEECVQDVFFQVWCQRTRWRVRESVRQYLYGAARNHALNVCKHHQVVQRWAAEAVHDHTIRGMGARPRPTDEDVRATELTQAVTRAVDGLPSRRRTAYLLRWRDGLSYAEIAQVMGISVKGVEIAVARALDVLRDELAPFF